MKMNKKGLGLLTVIMSVLLMGCGGGGGATKVQETQTDKEETVKPDEEIQTVEGKSFSEFEAYNLDMEIVNQEILKDYDLTMINIWGTFCGPCIREMPDLGAISREYSEKGFQIIGIPVDVSDDSMLAKAKEIVEKTEADYVHLLPSEDLGNIYLNSVTAVPETLFVDKEGKILQTEVGSKSKEEWIKIIDGILETVKSE